MAHVSLFECNFSSLTFICKAISTFYWHHFDLESKYSVRLKSFLLQGLSEPEFYDVLVYKFRTRESAEPKTAPRRCAIMECVAW